MSAPTSSRAGARSSSKRSVADGQAVQTLWCGDHSAGWRFFKSIPSSLSGARSVARGTKLRRRIPVRPLIASGKLASDGIIKLQIFDSARPVPVRVIFVLGSVIAIGGVIIRSEEHTSELQSLMRISYAVFCLKKNN